MEKYKFIHLGKDECVSGCVASVLDKRRFYAPGITDISKSLGVGPNGVVIDENLEPLKSFFSSQGFNLTFYKPSETNIVEPDTFLEDALKKGDVMAGFRYLQLYDAGGDKGHFALVSGFNIPTDRVYLHDNQRRKVEVVPFIKLVRAMHDEVRGGFYLIEDGRQIK